MGSNAARAKFLGVDENSQVECELRKLLWSVVTFLWFKETIFLIFGLLLVPVAVNGSGVGCELAQHRPLIMVFRFLAVLKHFFEIPLNIRQSEVFLGFPGAFSCVFNMICSNTGVLCGDIFVLDIRFFDPSVLLSAPGEFFGAEQRSVGAWHA